MIKTTTQTVEKKIMTSAQCDRCKTEYSDAMDIQEFLFIDEIGGYQSAIGDDVHFQLDLCSDCQKVMFEGFLRFPDK